DSVRFRSGALDLGGHFAFVDVDIQDLAVAGVRSAAAEARADVKALQYGDPAPSATTTASSCCTRASRRIRPLSGGSKKLACRPGCVERGSARPGRFVS